MALAPSMPSGTPGARDSSAAQASIERGPAPATGARGDEPIERLLSLLGSSRDGLTDAAAGERLARDGPNDLSARVASPVRDLLRGLASPLTLVLVVASVASEALGQPADAAIIATVLALGAGLDFFQTYRSHRAVQRLQSRLAPTATAIRGGTARVVPRRAIVVGDVVRLAAGDLVPGDARLLESRSLHVQQSALTGESLPAEKAASDAALRSIGPDSAALVFAGTSIVSGTASAVVLATGARTSFGHVVAHIASRPEETEFERGARRFGALVLRVVVLLVLFVLVVTAILRRDPLESLLFAVALAVGMTPEFLPMITSVTLARGAVRMARADVIVKHLASIQNLGAIDVLCSDKTGTITSGTMKVDGSLDPLGASSARPLALAWLNSHFETGVKSALDDAISAERPAEPDGWSKIDEIPFDFERRRVGVVLERDGEHVLVVKGAPESVLACCTAYEVDGHVRPLDPAARARCTETVGAASARGARSIAVARRGVPRATGLSSADETGLVLVGFVTFADPLLDDAGEAVAALRRDGVAVKILSGDDPLVAAHVCARAGIDAQRVVTGDELDALDEPALAHVAERTSVFARVTPAQKHRIVQALRHHGHVVGFFGDGINDAPSLHGSDVGISASGAVDVAREAADIVLLEKRLDVLHAGIIEGRRACGNILKYLLMGTSSSFGNMVSMAGAIAFLPFLPMLPMQLLLNNFLYDLAQVTIPTDRVDAAYLRRPQRWDVRAIRDFMLVVGPLSSVFDALTFAALLLLFRLDEAGFHTGWFVESLATQTLVLFVIRTVSRPWAERPSAPLFATTLLVVLVGIALPYSPLAPVLRLEPLPPTFLAFVAVVTTAYLVLVEIVKERVMGRLVAPRAPAS